jgi:CubicO group peptidase (beta-lactamase class C family)
MFVLGAYIVSHTTGTPFHTFITDNIISPLGLTWTTYNSSKAEQSGKLADGFLDNGVIEAWNGDRKPRFKPVPCLISGDNLSAGPGGVISNAKDLVCALDYILETLFDLNTFYSRRHGCRRSYYLEGLRLQITPLFLLLLLTR